MPSLRMLQLPSDKEIRPVCSYRGGRGGAVGWGTALQTGRSRIRFPIMSVDFFTIDFVGRTMALGSTQPLTEMSTRNIPWGINAASAYGWQPTTFLCRLSRNLGASTSWNPVGQSRPVMGLRYLRYYRTCSFITALKQHVTKPCPKHLLHNFTSTSWKIS
jgi:hypothetical protein